MFLRFFSSNLGSAEILVIWRKLDNRHLFDKKPQPSGLVDFHVFLYENSIIW